MDFVCVRCVGKSFPRLRGWKSHMTREHGGYDESDVARAIAASEGSVSEDNVAQRMESFARTVNAQQNGGAVETSEPTAQGSQDGKDKTAPPTPNVKTVRATPKRLQKILGGIPTKILESQIELDDDDRKALDEAGEFLSDIFGVEFEVPQDKRVLHSRFWALVWVAGVACLIYIKHRFADIWVKVLEQYKEQKPEQPVEETVGRV